MKKFAIIVCIGFLGLIVSEVFAKKQIRNDFTGRRQYIANKGSDLLAIYTVNNVGTDTTLTSSYHNVFVDTDSANVTITLPAGVAGTEYRIVNVGTSTNNVAITPDGSENLIGANSNFTLSDAESLIIVWDDTKGWY